MNPSGGRTEDGTPTPEFWEQVKEVFARVCDVAADDRPEWLASECGNDDLRAEVESLLNFTPDLSSPEQPSSVAEVPEFPPRMRPGPLLGRGGFSDVYAVTDDTWGAVAVKRLRISDAESIQRFKREFRLRKHPHPNLVRVYELLEYGSEWLLVMERLEGTTLRETLDRNPGGLSLSRVNQIVVQIAAGLNTLHDDGILHRDLKPDNVWLTPDERVVLLDFGLAVKADRRGRRLTTKLFGAAEYIAPERLVRKGDSAAGDWYSVGVMIREMLCGDLPDGEEATEGAADSALEQRIPEPIRALSAALLQKDPERRASAREVAEYLAGRYPVVPKIVVPGETPRSDRPGRPRLIGREKEFQLLQDCFRKTTQGQPVCVFLTGESGTGKTELAEAFLSSVSWAVTLQGRCHESESVPFKACDALIDDLASMLRGMPSEIRNAMLPRNMPVLERVFPVLAGLEPRRQGYAYPEDTEGLRNLAFLALRELAGRLADRKPVVMFIDDLQWGDDDSAMALAGLLSGLDAPSLLFIMSWRNENEDRGLPGWLRQNAGTFRAEAVAINLEPLAEADSEKLVRVLLDGASEKDGEDAPARIAAASGGNPFLIHELAAAHRRKRNELRQDTAAGEFERSLLAAMESRLSALSPSAGSLLGIIAVAGEALPDEVARKASGTGASYAKDREDLLDARVARAVNRGTHTDLDIYHARQRATISEIGRIDKAGAHGKIADAFIQTGNDPQRVYPHLRRSGNTTLCAEYAEKAGDKAFAQLAFGQSADLYEEAVGWLNNEQSSGALYLKLAEALAAAGIGAKAAQAYGRAALAGSEKNEDWRLSMKVLAAGQLLYCGELDSGLAAFREVCAEAGVPYPGTTIALYSSILWLRLKLRARGLRPGNAGEPSLRRRAQMDTCWTGLIGTSMLETTRSAAYSARYLWWALESGEPRRMCRAMAAEAAISSAAPFAGIQPELLIAEARRINSRLEGAPEEAFLSSMAAIVACNLGDWNQCRDEGGKAFRHYVTSGTGAGWERVTAATYWLSGRIMTGDWNGAVAEMPALILEGASRRDRFAAVNLYLLSNFYLAELGEGRPRDAAIRAEQLQKEWRQPRFDMQKFCAVMIAIDCALYEGDAESAWKMWEAAKSEMRASELQQIKVLRVRWEYTGARCAIGLAKAGGSLREKYLHQAEVSSKWLGKTGQRPGIGLGAMTMAGIESVRGNRDSADIRLGIAMSQFRETGMRPLHAFCEARLSGVTELPAWFREQKIADPKRLLNTLAPGNW